MIRVDLIDEGTNLMQTPHEVVLGIHILLYRVRPLILVIHNIYVYEWVYYVYLQLCVYYNNYYVGYVTYIIIL